MDSDSSSPAGLCSDSDFGFAFNNNNFSDRILTIEIIPDFLGRVTGRKRPREDDSIDGDEDKSDGESNSSDAPVEDDDPPLNLDCSQVLIRVKTIHICSAVLAAKSRFFFKMFSNGMRESEQRRVNLRIHDSEEAPLMELLNFMYSGSLSASAPRALLDILMAADKFEVASCMKYCSKLLLNLPMTCESALLYLHLDLPSSVSLTEAVQPLKDSAKQFLAAHYKDLTESHEEVLKLPLAGIEAVFSSDNLQVYSEDQVCDFLLKWARLHYAKLQDRRKVFGSHIGHLIRFPYMTSHKLKELSTCNDFEPEFASEAVVNALYFKADSLYNRTCHERYAERAYKCLPINVVHFKFPCQQCVVYLELKREECLQLFPAGAVSSQEFYLGGQSFSLFSLCVHTQTTDHRFGLLLGMQEKVLATDLVLECELAARSKPTENYVSMYKGCHNFKGTKPDSYRKLLFGMMWTKFIAEGSNVYFINDVFHLRVDLTVRKQVVADQE